MSNKPTSLATKYIQYERGRRELYFDTSTGEITSDNGVTFTPAEAAELFKAGDFTDSNISFNRLATRFEFDVDACLAWYAEQE